MFCIIYRIRQASHGMLKSERMIGVIEGSTGGEAVYERVMLQGSWRGHQIRTAGSGEGQRLRSQRYSGLGSWLHDRVGCRT